MYYVQTNLPSPLWQFRLQNTLHYLVEKCICQPETQQTFLFCFGLVFSVKDIYQGRWCLLKMHFQWIFFILTSRLDSGSETWSPLKEMHNVSWAPCLDILLSLKKYSCQWGIFHVVFCVCFIAYWREKNIKGKCYVSHEELYCIVAQARFSLPYK